MTPRRFAALAAAYGGRIDRWPEAEQPEATAFLLGNPDGRAALDREAVLDRALATLRSEAGARGPSAALASRIASGTVARADRLGRVRVWWSGIWATGALAAGAAAGIVAVGLSATTPREGAAPFAAGLTLLGAPLDDDPGPRR